MIQILTLVKYSVIHDLSNPNKQPYTTMNMIMHPNVPAILPPRGELPPGFRLIVPKWSYTPERMNETILVDGQRIKKLLTLDINIPSDTFAGALNDSVLWQTGSVQTAEIVRRFAMEYECENGCKDCFNKAKVNNPVMTPDQVTNMLRRALKLGLESVKFLGPGEFIRHPHLFRILDFCHENNITFGLFTKAAALGNDELAQHYQGMSAERLVERLVKYPLVNFLVSARSFNPTLENGFVPRNRRQWQLAFDYHQARNRAIELLCSHGIHTNLMHQRMALICSPVTPDNIEEAFGIYEWGVERNMPTWCPPTMVSGKGQKIEHDAAETAFQDRYIELAAQIYIWNVRRGIMTMEQIKEEGVHPYLGLAPCNQIGTGMYVRYDGTVLRCPGNDDDHFVIAPDVREQDLLDIWKGSSNYRDTRFNNHCPAKDGRSLDVRFYTEVPRRIEQLLLAA